MSDTRQVAPSFKRAGFSLLEIIIATAILAASGILLMSMFSTADRHGRRAEERVIAQMLCQSKLQELLATPDQILPIEGDVFPQYPGWIYNVSLAPTAIERFVRLTVQVTHIPGTEVGVDLGWAAKASDESQSTSLMVEQLPAQPTYELVRWFEFEGDLTAMGLDGSAGAMTGPSL